MFEKSRTYLVCHLSGFAHWDGIEVFKGLEVGTAVELVAEPDNPFDPNAVAVFLGKSKLGYIPRSHNESIALLLENGHTDLFEAYINRISPEEHPERQIGLTVKVARKEG